MARPQADIDVAGLWVRKTLSPVITQGAHSKIGLTALIPLDLNRRPKQLIRRLEHLVRTMSTAGIAVVVGHNDRGSKWDKVLQAQASSRWPALAQLASGCYYKGPPNNSVLRNRAFSLVSTPYVLLLDVDIHPDIPLFYEMLEAVTDKREPFAMAPCLYLTRHGTRLIDKTTNSDEIVERYLRFDNRMFEHLASPSSVMILRTEDFARIDGFCEDYCGHGYEDFDFMMRLGVKAGVIGAEREMLVDCPYRAPLLAEGFRAMLAHLCIDRILERRIALHLHHGKARREPYYEKRAENSRIFRSRMSVLFGVTEVECIASSSALIDAFFRKCKERDLRPADFYVLLDARPIYLLRRWRGLRRIWAMLSSFRDRLWSRKALPGSSSEVSTDMF